MFLVELVCQNEKKVVAKVQASGALDAHAIQLGLHEQDPKRCPPKIADGEQLLCRLCKGLLWFRTRTGELLAACPGTLTIQG